ncbi:MAG TPA: lipopolysaccharide biosynthesis protein, partial [Chromatiales bacterium]|nr:lipopolysaccharide biosynthesis protein [Chromatiales bacterium]
MASSSDDQSSRQPPLRRPPATGPGLNTKSAATTVGSSWDEFLRLIQGSGFIFACRVSGAALTLLTQILLARWMGAAELGVYVLGFSWCVLLGTMSTLGFSPAAMRFINLGLARGESGYIKAFIRHSIRLISIASMAAAVTGLTLIWTVLELDRDKALTLSVALAIVPVFSLLHFICATANGYSRFALGFLPTSVLRPATFCCLVALWWWSGATLHAPVAMGLQATAIVVVVLPTALYFRGFIRSQDSHAETPPEPRLWLRTSLSLLIGAIFTGYFPEIIIILSGTILPSDELALLHVSFRIAMLVSFGLFAIDAFTAPDAARLYAAGDRPGLEAVVNRATRLRFLVSLIAVLAFVVLG